MTLRTTLLRVTQQEEINFLLTNRLPRRLATRLAGWVSRIEQPLVRRISFAAWRTFCDLDLSDAETQEFRSLHDCFTRRLKAGARPVDPDPAVLVSPNDGIVGACGTIERGRVMQIKGLGYTLSELLGGTEDARWLEGGCYATLRLTAGMYHHFHAPHDLQVEQVTCLYGDTWNVNPIALRRVERLFCRNERAVIRARLGGGNRILIVPVAAILVAGIRLTFLDVTRGRREAVARRFSCDTQLSKGDEMGWFEHGSTILLFAPRGFSLCDNLVEGSMIRAGQPLMHCPEAYSS
jgi:phosphatidylserine decarboxylase